MALRKRKNQTMNNIFFRLLLAGALVLGVGAPALAATHPTPKPRVVTIHLPSKPLHTWFDVEVNRLGQVVRVTNGAWSNDTGFNHHTYGNVLQMWIRRPDGSAVVGVYRVTFNYNPHTKGIARTINLLKTGGNWGSDRGAALTLLDKSNQAPQKLPSLGHIVGPSKPPHG